MSMRAAVLTAFGAPLEITELDVPVPGRGEVLLRVLASGINPLDMKIRLGQAAHAQTDPPAVLGIDMAGVVAGVKRYRPCRECPGMGRSQRHRAHHGHALRAAAQLAEAGRLTPRLDSRQFTFDDLVQAYDAVENATATGKVVAEISP